MIESVDAFERIRTTYFHWLVFCSIAVALGVVVEESGDFFEYLLDKSWFMRRVPIPVLVNLDGYKRLIKRVARTAWVVLIVGVAGEGLFEFLVSNEDALLEKATSTRLENAAAAIDALDKAVTNALEDAKEASAKAGNAVNNSRAAESESRGALALAT